MTARQHATAAEMVHRRETLASLKPQQETPWAEECARLEKSGTRGYYLAAVQYQERYAEGESQESIAAAVTEAGFRIHQTTVGRRLKALDGLSVTLEPSSETLESYAFAYAGVSNAHVSNNSGEVEWYTPPEYIAAAVDVMGGIDLDPASTLAANEVVGAATFYGMDDGSLDREWGGRVWMNPPYARPLIDGFCGKLAEEDAAGNVTQACALTNNATETGWFHALAEVGAAICFPRHRVKFWHPDRPAAAAPLQGQAVMYLGTEVEAFRREFLRFGFTVALWRGSP